MNMRPLSFATALILAAALAPAGAQTGAPIKPEPPAAAASKPPRLLTPAESRDSSSPPGELRPEQAVVPQISIPLGRDKTSPSPAPAKADANAARRGSAAPVGGVNDATARCQAIDDDATRANCRDKLGRDARARQPA